MRVAYMSMANGPEASPPAASVPTPQLTILGLMVKLDTWLATDESVYIPTPVPMRSSLSPGPAAAPRHSAVEDSAVRNRTIVKKRRIRRRPGCVIVTTLRSPGAARTLTTHPVFLFRYGALACRHDAHHCGRPPTRRG